MVILTGSTDGLGLYLLSYLLQHGDVSVAYMSSIVHQHAMNDDRDLVSKEAAWISPFRVGGAGA